MSLPTCTGVSAFSTPPTVCILSTTVCFKECSRTDSYQGNRNTVHKNTAQTQPQLTALWSEASTHTQSARRVRHRHARTRPSPHCDARAVSGGGASEPRASAELSGHLSVTIQFLARQPATVARQSATVAEGWLGRR